MGRWRNPGGNQGSRLLRTLAKLMVQTDLYPNLMAEGSGRVIALESLRWDDNGAALTSGSWRDSTTARF